MYPQKIFICAPRTVLNFILKEKKRMKKEIRVWLLIVSLNIIMIGSCLYAESVKAPVSTEPVEVEQEEDIIRWKVDDVEEEIYIEPLEMEPVTDAVPEPTMKSLGEFKLTAYCACEKCCFEWADGITASGTIPTEGRTIAVDPNVIPYGTVVTIEGYGEYIAEDCSINYIHEKEIDIFFESHETALEFGIQYAEVFICQ